MHKDIALGLVCLAAFALALMYVAQAPRFDREQEDLTIEVLRKLLRADLPQGIAAVDEVIRSARGPSGARTTMRSMSLLAEVNDPAIESALHAYTWADAKLVRLHAAKLLERVGSKASALRKPDSSSSKVR